MIAGFFRALLIAIIGIPVTLAGLIVVPIALHFAKTDFYRTKFTQYEGWWAMTSLPGWARFWDNPVDGAQGDQRGWWNNYCLQHYGKPATAFWCMFQWLAVTNPANYWSRVTTGVDEARCERSLKAEGRYWKLWQAVRDDGVVFPLFEGAIPLGKTPNKGVNWRIGWKIDLDVITPDMPPSERFRGSVFRIRPYASI